MEALAIGQNAGAGDGGSRAADQTAFRMRMDGETVRSRSGHRGGRGEDQMWNAYPGWASLVLARAHRAEPGLSDATTLWLLEWRSASGRGHPSVMAFPEAEYGVPSHYKKSFCGAAKNPIFPFNRKGLILLGESVLFSQRFMKGEKCVNPTIGFRFRVWVW